MRRLPTALLATVLLACGASPSTGDAPTAAARAAASGAASLHIVGRPLVMTTGTGDERNSYLVIRLREQLKLKKSGGVRADITVAGGASLDGVDQISSIRRHCYRSVSNAIAASAQRPVGESYPFVVQETGGGAQRRVTGRARIAQESQSAFRSIGCGGRKRR
jgi:hypothetical protein